MGRKQWLKSFCDWTVLSCWHYSAVSKLFSNHSYWQAKIFSALIMHSLSSLCSNMKCPPKDHLLNTLPLTGGSVLVSGGGNGRKYDIAGKITSQETWLGKFHLFLSPFSLESHLSWSGEATGLQASTAHFARAHGANNCGLKAFENLSQSESFLPCFLRWFFLSKLCKKNQ